MHITARQDTRPHKMPCYYRSNEPSSVHTGAGELRASSSMTRSVRSLRSLASAMTTREVASVTQASYHKLAHTHGYSSSSGSSSSKHHLQPALLLLRMVGTSLWSSATPWTMPRATPSARLATSRPWTLPPP